MATASITKMGGVVVVTQVIPQDEAGQIPMQTPGVPPTDTKAPPTASQAPPPQSSSTTKMDDTTATFLKGEPEILGAIQILIGLLCILFSLTAIFSPVLIYHAPLCIGVIFIISGSVALKAKRNTSVASVWWTLILNLLSVIFSLGGVAYLSWCFAAVLPTVIVCGEEMNPQPYDPYGRQFNCNERLWLLDVVVHGLWGFYLVLLVFQACVSITLVVFSGKAIRHSVHYGPVQVLVSDYDSDVGLLDPEPSTPTLDSP
ncbi:membrane-spanning 4-domains subfamily A member 15-like [Sphaeramia orbicularis]|uniref:membrane-spanning 4-domains subfamily A member 15-like n=1 Tax=Sphaeramia orbicularis TaxID=375764 RepID=UPI00117DA50E|nr:membrane-spanning 4-domains subfamily A member 15-like [Sphaeramia orbicularis]